MINQFLVRGFFIKIYPSKSNPDRVFKVGKIKVVKEWLDLFEQYPEYFPLVYRSGILKNGLYYVEVEKLDNQRVKNEWRDINRILARLKMDGVSERQHCEYIETIWNMDDDDVKIVLSEFIRTAPESYDLIKSWIMFLRDVNALAEGRTGWELDSHSGNFGYDKEGNKKCLDI